MQKKKKKKSSLYLVLYSVKHACLEHFFIRISIVNMSSYYDSLTLNCEFDTMAVKHKVRPSGFLRLYIKAHVARLANVLNVPTCFLPWVDANVD